MQLLFYGPSEYNSRKKLRRETQIQIKLPHATVISWGPTLLTNVYVHIWKFIQIKLSGMDGCFFLVVPFVEIMENFDKCKMVSNPKLRM